MKTGFTDPYVKNLKAPGRYTDPAVSGLNLNIKRQGGKYWVFRYLFAGKRRDLSSAAYIRSDIINQPYKLLSQRLCQLLDTFLDDKCH
jgi:hypothetical protein